MIILQKHAVEKYLIQFSFSREYLAQKMCIWLLMFHGVCIGRRLSQNSFDLLDGILYLSLCLERTLFAVMKISNSVKTGWPQSDFCNFTGKSQCDKRPLFSCKVPSKNLLTMIWLGYQSFVSGKIRKTVRTLFHWLKIGIGLISECVFWVSGTDDVWLGQR